MSFELFIVGASSAYLRGLAIVHDGKPEPVFSLPFGRSFDLVHSAVPLNRTEVLALGANGTLAVCRAEDGETLRQTGSKHGFASAFVFDGGRRFLIQNRNSVVAWHSDPLAQDVQFNGLFCRPGGGCVLRDLPRPTEEQRETERGLESWREQLRALNLERLNPISATSLYRECQDGHLLIGYSEDRGAEKPVSGFYQIDPNVWTVEKIVAPDRDAYLESRGDLVAVPAQACSKTPQALRDGFEAFANRVTKVSLPLNDLDLPSVRKALSSLSAQIERDLRQLIWGNYLRLRFFNDNWNVPEESFFDALVDRNFPVAPILRRLMLAFLRQIDGETIDMPWQEDEEGTAALGYALRALVLLDPASLDVMRLYMSKRDGGHESYCGDRIFPEYLDRHGWRDEATLKFGAFFAINRIWGGRNARWNEYGLVDAAANMISADEFAEIVLEEIEAHDRGLSHQEPNGPHYLHVLLLDLDRKRRYHGKLIEAFERLAPGTMQAAKDLG